MGRVSVNSLGAFPTDAGAVGVSTEEPDDEIGAAVMKAVLTMVEMTSTEFDVMVVKVKVAITKI